MSVRTRLWMMASGWGSVGVAYTVGSFAPGAATVLREGPIERLLALAPVAVWCYLSFFALVPAAFLMAAPQRVRLLTRSMQLCALSCAVVFLCWPTTLVYPAIAANTLSGRVLRELASSDCARNCLPSLHGALTLLCVLALRDRRHGWRSVAVALWGLAIMASVIQTRRHLSVDLGAGVALGAGCAWCCARFAYHRTGMTLPVVHRASRKRMKRMKRMKYMKRMKRMKPAKRQPASSAIREKRS